MQAQWVKGSGIATAAAWAEIELRPDPWPWNSINRRAAKKEKESNFHVLSENLMVGTLYVLS